MKKTILLLAFLLPMALNAQQALFEFEQVSNTIVNDNKVWYGCHGVSEVIRFYGDTIVNDVTYKKLCEDKDSTLVFTGVLMREDSGRVYAYDVPVNSVFNDMHSVLRIPLEEEYVLYDFNWKEGDCVDHLGIVTSVDTIFELDKLRKRIEFNSIELIDGIGCREWGLYYPRAHFYVPMPHRVTCVYENGVLIYEDGYFSCGECGTWGSVTVSENKISVVPSIVQTQFSIQAESTVPFQISVVDMQGRTHLQETVSAGESVDCQCLPAGVYLVAVQTQEGEVVAVERIVKQ